MDLLGIGPLELAFILIIALIIFGPNDIVRAGRTLGKFLRRVVTSDGWRAFQQASKGMRDLPTTLIREAGLEEEELKQLSGMNDFQEVTKGLENQISPWTTPPTQRKDSSGKIASPADQNPSDLAEDEISATEQENEPLEPKEPPPGSPFSETIDDNN
jgi:Sec-independent protein translocase protein TatA